MTGRFRSVAGTAAEWSAALRLMDKSGRLSQRQTNRLLDTIAQQADAERALAARVLRRRIAENKVRR